MKTATKMSQQMAVQVSKKTVEWYTPSDLIALVRDFFGGEMHLDPASNVAAQERIRARRWFGPEQAEIHCRDGLLCAWRGNVFLNPPYLGKTAEWVKKAEFEAEIGNTDRTILLIKSVPGYEWWEKLWRKYPVCMLRRRVRFIDENGNQNGEAKQGSTIAFIGPEEERERFGEVFGHLGRVIKP